MAYPYAMSANRARPGAMLLAVGSTALILILAAFRLTDAPVPLQFAAGVLLLLSFGWLTIVWFQGAVALALLELSVAGASGNWLVLPPGLSGRMLLDGIVIAGAIGALLGARRRTGSWALGRFAPHAAALAIAIPAVWMTIGMLNGHRLSDVFGDGNGHIAFLLTLPLLVLVRDGRAAWIRGWLLTCCTVNAVVTGALIAISVPRIVPVWPTLNELLLGDLVMGGAVGYMPSGAYRLYLGSGIYLQVGLALVTWQLLHATRFRLGYWALYVVLWADVIATYTRGFWLGAILAVGVVLFLGAANIRRPLEIIALSASLFLAATAVGLALGFSLPDYFLGRLLTVFELPAVPTLGGGVTPDAVPVSTSPAPADSLRTGLAFGPATLFVLAWLTVAAGVAGALGAIAAGRRGSRPTTGLVAAAVIAALALGPGLLRPSIAAAIDATPSLALVVAPLASPAPTPAPSPAPGEEISNQIRSVQFQVLTRHVLERPVTGHGFGAIASDYPYGSIYSYELGYLDLLYKTGVVGLVLFLSYPASLIFAALVGRWGRRRRLPSDVSSEALSVVLAIIPSILLSGATNPYILAAFGLAPILVTIAWLETARLPVLAPDANEATPQSTR